MDALCVFYMFLSLSQQYWDLNSGTCAYLTSSYEVTNPFHEGSPLTTPSHWA
jgi:hypothetical protein